MQEWTWKRGANAARYDRVYTWTPATTLVTSTAAGILKEGLWSTLTDHVALCVDLSINEEGALSRPARESEQLFDKRPARDYGGVSIHQWKREGVHHVDGTVDVRSMRRWRQHRKTKKQGRGLTTQTHSWTHHWPES